MWRVQGVPSWPVKPGLARAAQEGDTFEAGDVVIISAVSGAKLLVAAAKQEHEVEKV